MGRALERKRVIECERDREIGRDRMKVRVGEREK